MPRSGAQVGRLGASVRAIAVAFLSAALLTMEAQAGTYGSYREAFPGFAIGIPIMIGSMSPHSAEQGADRYRREQARRRVAANLPLLHKMREHFQKGNHPFAESRALLGDAMPTQEDWPRMASVPLESEFTLYLLLVSGLSPGLLDDARATVATQFTLAQFMAGGPGTLPLPVIKPTEGELEPVPLGQASTDLCMTRQPLYGILRALVVERAPDPPAGDACVQRSLSILRAALQEKAPPRSLLGELWKLPPLERSGYLRLVAQVASPRARSTLRSEWLPEMRAHLEDAFLEEAQLAADQEQVLSFSALLRVPPEPLSGAGCLARMATARPEEAQSALRWILRTRLPIRSAAAILRAALRRFATSPEVTQSIVNTIREAPQPIAELEPVLYDLLAAPTPPSDFWEGTILAIAGTRSPGLHRGALWLALLRRAGTIPSTLLKTLGETRERLPESRAILDELVQRTSGSVYDVEALLALSDRPAWRPVDGVSFLQALLLRRELHEVTRAELLARLRRQKDLPAALAQQLDRDAEAHFRQAVAAGEDPGLWGAELGRSALPRAQKLALVQQALRTPCRGSKLASLMAALVGTSGLTEPAVLAQLAPILAHPDVDWQALETLSGALADMDAATLRRVPRLAELLAQVVRHTATGDGSLRRILTVLLTGALAAAERRPLLQEIASSRAGDDETRERARKALELAR